MARNTARDKLIALAKQARLRAYAPYSRFKVGAALRGRKGGLYGGCNVENVAYPQGCCAEAAALAALVLDGEREVVEVAVVAAGKALISPCGGCRQRLREFAKDSTPVHLCHIDGNRVTTTLGKLLPRSFAPKHLGK